MTLLCIIIKIYALLLFPSVSQMLQKAGLCLTNMETTTIGWNQRRMEKIDMQLGHHFESMRFTQTVSVPWYLMWKRMIITEGLMGKQKIGYSVWVLSRHWDGSVKHA